MLSEALRLTRVSHDVKQTELADRLGISKSHLSEIEKGSSSPGLSSSNATRRSSGFNNNFMFSGCSGSQP